MRKADHVAPSPACETAPHGREARPDLGGGSGIDRPAVAAGRVTVCPPAMFDPTHTLFGTKGEAPSFEEIDALLKAERSV